MLGLLHVALAHVALISALFGSPVPSDVATDSLVVREIADGIDFETLRARTGVPLRRG